MVETRRLTRLVEDALGAAVFPDGELTVALSGGADSAALAYLTLASGAHTRAIHIDHGLPGSPLMSEAARDVAATLGIECDVVRVELGPGPSLEERARDARYPALHRIDGPVLTAHTREDNAETILFNLARGTGPDGLAGIPQKRPPNVHRPILDVSRSETREISVLAGLAFRDDPMNSDPAFTRNRIRHRVIPLLTELNPQVVESLARAGNLVRRDTEYLASLVAEIDVSQGLAVSIVTVLPPPLADRLLARFLVSAGVGVSADRIERLREVVRGDAPRQELAGGRQAVRHGAMVVVE